MAFKSISGFIVVSLLLAQTVQLNSYAQTSSTTREQDPLVTLLINKGVITTQEAQTILAAADVTQQRDRLATLLKDKGLISAAEFEALRGPAANSDNHVAVNAGPPRTSAPNPPPRSPEFHLKARALRLGVNFEWLDPAPKTVGGTRSWKLQPEFAIVFPAFGDVPTNVADQLGFGERQGADSNRPGIQGRTVVQWQLDKAEGVVPAQLIFSFEHARRTAIVTAANVPAQFSAAFPV